MGIKTPAGCRSRSQHNRKMILIWGFLAFMVLVYVFQQLKKDKRLPPGPTPLPIIGHLHLLGKNPHHDLSNLARKYGPLMGLKFGFKPIVVVSSPAAAELILKTHDLNFASRPQTEYGQYIVGNRDLVCMPYCSEWRNLRKLTTLQLLGHNKISQFQGTRRAELDLMVGSLRNAAQTRETVNLSALVFGLVWDINCLMMLGSKYSETGFGNSAGLKAVFLESSDLAAKFNLGDYFPLIGGLDLQGLRRRMKSLSNVFDCLTDKIIDDHLQNKGDKKGDFVDTLIAVLESGEAGFEFDRRHVRGLLLDMLVAGTDTSAATIDWVLAELIRHPSILKKLQEELDSVVGKNHMVEESHLLKLEYLDYVVKEAFRLHPVVPLLLPHESIEHCVVDGLNIPKKATIMVNIWSIGRDPSVWHEPELFIPERFVDRKIDVKGQNFELLPFGSGRRGCPGMHMGFVLVKLVVAQLTHCFSWELPNGMRPTDMDMSERFGMVTTRENNLLIIPNYRLEN